MSEESKPFSCSSPFSPPPSSPPLPLQHPRRFHSLPGFAYDGITCFLADMDLNRLMAVARWLMELCQGQVREVILKKGTATKFCLLRSPYEIDPYYDAPCLPPVIYVDPHGRAYGPPPCLTYLDHERKARVWPDTIHSDICLHPDLLTRLFSRRPGVQRVVIQDDGAALALAETMMLGQLGDNIQCLGLRIDYPDGLGLERVCDALGLCALPCLTSVDIYGHGDHSFGGGKQLNLRRTIALLGAALNARVIRVGCKGLKKLSLSMEDLPGRYHFRTVTKYSPESTSILLSGACEELEELVLKQCKLGDEPLEDAVAMWLLRTGAPHLRVLIAPCQSGLALATALSSSGIAPRLQVLAMGGVEQASVQVLSVAMERDAWPCLEQLSLVVANDSAEKLVIMMEALHVCSPNMRVLRIEGQCERRSDLAAMAVVRALDEALPDLQELSLRNTDMGCKAMVELSRALKVRPPSLHKLDVSGCNIKARGMRELASAINKAGGAGAHLQSLDISNNHLEYLGAVHLVDAMTSGGVKQLQELHIQGAGLGEAGRQLVIDALKSNACPRLKWRTIPPEITPINSAWLK